VSVERPRAAVERDVMPGRNHQCVHQGIGRCNNSRVGVVVSLKSYQ